jgi:hypothetical protein
MATEQVYQRYIAIYYNAVVIREAGEIYFIESSLLLHLSEQFHLVTIPKVPPVVIQHTWRKSSRDSDTVIL